MRPLGRWEEDALGIRHSRRKVDKLVFPFRHTRMILL
jgi:hypothetical protein